MFDQLMIGIVVGLVIAYIFVRLARSNARKVRDDTPGRPETSKFFVDDTTKLYMVIAGLILFLIIFLILQ